MWGWLVGASAGKAWMSFRKETDISVDVHGLGFSIGLGVAGAASVVPFKLLIWCFLKLYSKPFVKQSEADSPANLRCERGFPAGSTEVMVCVDLFCKYPEE